MRARTVTYAIGLLGGLFVGLIGAATSPCGSDDTNGGSSEPSTSTTTGSGDAASSHPNGSSKPLSDPPPATALAGNPDGKCAITSGAGPEDGSSPTTWSAAERPRAARAPRS